MIARIAQVEVASVFARKVRGNFISVTDEALLLSLFQRDLSLRFGVTEIDEALCSHAANLAHLHGLSAYDSVQLACAIKVDRVFSKLTGNRVVFICADHSLLQAASIEQITIDNPENYP